MSRTRRKHTTKPNPEQPKVRSHVGLAAIAQTGAGVHTKSHKQRRVNERARLRKEFS
jgi:hypothetical protein